MNNVKRFNFGTFANAVKKSVQKSELYSDVGICESLITDLLKENKIFIPSQYQDKESIREKIKEEYRISNTIANRYLHSIYNVPRKVVKKYQDINIQRKIPDYFERKLLPNITTPIYELTSTERNPFEEGKKQTIITDRLTELISTILELIQNDPSIKNDTKKRFKGIAESLSIYNLSEYKASDYAEFLANAFILSLSQDNTKGHEYKSNELPETEAVDDSNKENSSVSNDIIIDSSFCKDFLKKQADRLNAVRALGEYNSTSLTLENSYVNQMFVRELSKSEQRQNEKGTDPTGSFSSENVSEGGFLLNLKNERFAVVVGDAGQGKSSFVKKICVDITKQQDGEASQECFFPIYFECKSINQDSFDDNTLFYKELAKKAKLEPEEYEYLLNNGKTLFIFDGMDETSPTQMDRLIEAIYEHLVQKITNSYFIFTSRPGQKLVAGGEDMKLNNNDETLVRRYSIKAFDEEQRDKYIEYLAKAKGTDEPVKERFKNELIKKENEIDDYQSISRNPFMVFAVFSTYKKSLPSTRFVAILRVMDDIIKRDLAKNGCEHIKLDNIKTVLGAISFLIYKYRDNGEIFFATLDTLDTLVETAKEIYNLRERDADDRRIIEEYSSFFKSGNMFDENGFRHELFASTYAAYYMLYLITECDLLINSEEITLLKKNTDYWKSVTESLLCLLDRTSLNGKDYIVPLLDELQNAQTPDYDTLCKSVSQFTRNQKEAALCILRGMLKRGCDGIKYGNQTDSVFVCSQGTNPYEELFYYTAIYPEICKYLSDFTPTKLQDEQEEYLQSELLEELKALSLGNADNDLQKVYDNRKVSEFSDIVKKLEDAAHRTGRPTRGYVRLRDGTKKITPLNGFGFLFGFDMTGLSIPQSVISIAGVTFANCLNLSQIIIDNNNQNYHSIENCIIETAKKELVRGCNNCLKIPESVISIGAHAFEECENLTSIKISKSVITIGAFAFSGCKNLTSIDMPESVISIGAFAFAGCKNLTSIDIPESVISIGAIAFGGCINLTSIDIPKSVTSIGMNAFFLCRKLAKVFYQGTIEQWKEIEIGDGNEALKKASIITQ